MIFMDSEEAVSEEPVAEVTEPSGIESLLAKSIDELDLSARSANCLKNAKINNLRDLVRRTEKEMLETKNFGQRSLDEVLEVLAEHGLRLGMDVPEVMENGVSA